MATSFAPGFSALVASTQNGACQTMPSGFPFTITSARFFTSPRSIHRCAPFLNQSADAWMVFLYVPVPEKYFTPASWLSLHDDSFSRVIDGGAPRSGWKLTFHGPSIVASCVSVTLGSVRAVSLVGSRNTTNTVPHGSRCNGTVVRLSAILYDTGSDLPVSACQSSGALPFTRKLASTVSSRSLRLSTKYRSPSASLRCTKRRRASLSGLV